MGEVFSKPATLEQQRKWAKIWFKQFAVFHKMPQHSKRQLAEWDFTVDQVICFLRSKRDAGVPAWKRMKVLMGVMFYRRFVQERDIDYLQPIRIKMQEIISIESARGEGHDTIDESPGLINPNDPDAIQEFRRAIRKAGLKLGTERAYVGKLRAFMGDRGLTCLADFAVIWRML